MNGFNLLAYLEDPDQAAIELARLLRRGELSLVLGAGVSKGLGLPGWGKLVVSVESASGNEVGSEEAESKELMQRLDLVRDSMSDPAFSTLVRRSLYRDLESQGTYGESLLTQPMMIALGALVMSSLRGRVTDVYTLNFDDALDWYLHLHGLRTQTVSHLPTVLRGDVDVRIFHFHGFLPLMPRYQKTDWLVLTHDQLVERLAESDASPWSAQMGAEFLSKYPLFVGSSMSDTDVDVMLKRAAGFINSERVLGFAVGANLSKARMAALRRATIIPVSLPNYDDIPRFLLEVCQKAAADPSPSI